jgi:hypothetical protein
MAASASYDDESHLLTTNSIGLAAFRRRRATCSSRRSNCGFGVNHEQKQICFVDSRLNLTLDVLGQVVTVDNSNATRVNQFEIAVTFVHKPRNAIASHTGGRIDDGNEPFSEPVEQ